MDTVKNPTQAKTSSIHIRPLAGIMLICAGAALFLDQQLKTRWLTLMIIPAAGVILYLLGIRARHAGLTVAGGVMSGFGFGLAAAYNPGLPPQPSLLQVGDLLLLFGLGWLAVLLGLGWVLKYPVWWALLPFGIFTSAGASIILTPFHWTDLALYIGLGIALPLLAWGIGARLYGMMIAGSLLVTMGPGLYVAWAPAVKQNSLAQIGVMLIWFSAGWILITLISRAMYGQYAWWPLIPGGILAMVGFGLFIGGDPSNALGFISNTGAIGLMIFGLYLLLMRKGIHH